MTQVTAETAEQIVQQVGVQGHAQRLGMANQDRSAFVFTQDLQMKHMAPAQTGAQVFTQRQVLRGQQTRCQHPGLTCRARRCGVNKPVEGGMLLYRAVSLNVVHQHHIPLGVKGTGLGNARVQPTHAVALRGDGLRHGFQQVAFAATLLAPEVGGHRGAGVACQPKLQMLKGCGVVAGFKIGQGGTDINTDVQSNLPHAKLTCIQTTGHVTLS